MQGPCVGCGETNNLEIHHVKKLSNTVKAKNPIHIIMSKLGRKQVSICKKCHKDLDSGIYDKNKLPRKAQ